ncbi:MAG: anaerobic C4-dicarboxylate transporter family protein [Lachnospiraceae bacterium]|nr:anaerobic C4-dicarboxylate transporter family protein [Lachnospiraceae bacterium]
MFWIELFIVLLMIYWGTRKGGIFLALTGGIGMCIFSFILGVKPSDPPITVMLIILAVIIAAAAMESAGGLDYMVRLAEKILVKNPKQITIIAPIVAYIFTFLCGTGHIVYSLLPVMNRIALENGIRPERPISASIVSSQQAITACPISAATAALVGYLVVFQNVNLTTILIICVPATLIGTVAGAISVYKKGKELADDTEYQARVAAGLVINFKEHTEEKPVDKKAKLSVIIFMVGMLAIVLMGAFVKLRPVYADDFVLPMTTIIQMFMLVAGAFIVIFCKLDSSKIIGSSIFKSGMFALVLAFGLCWLVNTFIGDQSTFISDNMSALTNKYSWIFIIGVFIVGAITTSQASTTMIMIPIAIALNIPVHVIIAGWIACSSNYFIPASGQCVAALAFDTAGTTKIGKYVLNHSYMLPGLVTTIVSVIVALAIGAAIL